jgi:hypothetical protein
MLAIGLFITLIQTIRIFTISKLASYTNSYSIVVWSIVEINLGVWNYRYCISSLLTTQVVVCSIPSYAPLFRFARDKMFSSKKASSGNKSSDTKLNTWRKSVLGKSQSGNGPSDTESVQKGAIKATTVWSIEAERASLYNDDKPAKESV